jgi:23S rRNA (cytidine2498-2'-O)-methyltransferase
MSDSVTSPFVFATCQVGAEPALKAEMARARPDLRFSFSRPGFLTFKSVRSAGTELSEPLNLSLIFARSYGLSLGKTKAGAPAIVEAARSLKEAVRAKLRLHVFERDQHAPTEEPKDFERGLWAASARAAIRAEAGDGLFEADPVAGAFGEWVFDVIAVSEAEWWYGVHQHSARHSAFPGGNPELSLPADAPSRAYLKLQEALIWSGAPIRRGDHAVEIGSAPGGASLALLRRGVSVVGIDPAEMDPRVLNFTESAARFEHIRLPVAQVPREHLPAKVEWLLLDMNVEPRISLFAVDRLGTRMMDSLLGMLLTIKLNQWSMAAEIPSWFEHLKAIGMVKIRATQLAHNRQEIFVYGLTRQGRKREQAAGITGASGKPPGSAPVR